MKNRTFSIVAALVVLGGLGVGYWWFGPHTFHGAVIQSAEPAHDFTLNAAGGKTVSLSDYRGKLVVLYFGYTFCPDVCPATLANVSQALKSIGEKKASQVQVIMISVDPQRDTPEKLAEYVRHFNPTFVGVTGQPEKLEEIAALYGVFYEAHPGTAASGYLVDHTATLMVIDREGRLKLVLPFGVTADDIADDLDYMLR
ncbi:MAG: SCO family protein [Chloroflexota bacterium]